MDIDLENAFKAFSSNSESVRNRSGAWEDRRGNRDVMSCQATLSSP
jgi:hypothetical protein